MRNPSKSPHRFAAKRFLKLKHAASAVLVSVLMHSNANALDLLQAYREALINDAPFNSARAQAQAGQEKLPQGRAGLLPAIGLNGNYTRNKIDGTQSGFDIGRTITTNGYTLQLSQPLFRLANWEAYQQGKLAVAVSEAQFAQVQQDLIVRVAQAYFDVLTAQDALISIQAQKVAITEQLASAKRNFEVGTATITDTHEAQARYDLAIAQELATQNDLAVRRTALQQIIGKVPGELAPLRTDVKLSAPEPIDIERWAESAEQQNFNVIGQQVSLDIARREIKRNRAGHYPTVDLIASRTHNNQSTGGGASGGPGISSNFSSSNTDANAIGVQWTVPIFSGFIVNSRVREAIALEDRARFDLENARRSAAQAARQAFLGVNSGLGQIQALQAAQVSSQSALESNRLGYQVGVRINIDVLNAQQQLYLTQRDLSKARYDTLLNALRLKATAGLLKEDDVGLVNGLLIK